MIGADRLLGALLLIVACALYLALPRPSRVKRAWFFRGFALAVVLVIDVLIFIGGLDYAFGVHAFGADHHRPASYFFAFVTTASIVGFIAFFNSRRSRRSPPVGDDWLLWDLRAENDERAGAA